MTMEYIILEYRLSSEIDFSSLTYFSCLVKKKLPAACRGRAGQRGRPCITIAPAAGRPPNLFGERDHMQEEMHYITEEMAAEFAAALGQREYSRGTVENYLRSLRRFAAWSGCTCCADKIMILYRNGGRDRGERRFPCGKRAESAGIRAKKARRAGSSLFFGKPACSSCAKSQDHLAFCANLK